ncbi:hypothetical protein ACFL0N_01000 [Pseudomonadota bacterium]
MSSHSLIPEDVNHRANILDHASEFVELVYDNAPAEYRRLLASGRFHAELAQENAFNHGKLYVYAEFSVFRREFLRRFPDAQAAACINAFSSLLLKNDISITNLVDFLEGPESHVAARGSFLPY